MILYSILVSVKHVVISNTMGFVAYCNRKLLKMILLLDQ